MRPSEVRDLNKELIAGGTLQAIAKKYGVAVTSLQRHRIQCLGITRAADAVNVSAKLADIRAKLPKPEEIGNFYAVLRAQLAEIVDDALSKGQAMIAVTAIDKIRLNLDSVSRIAGLDRRADPASPLQVNVDLGSLVDRLVESIQGANADDAIKKLEKMIDAG